MKWFAWRPVRAWSRVDQKHKLVFWRFVNAHYSWASGGDGLWVYEIIEDMSYYSEASRGPEPTHRSKGPEPITPEEIGFLFLAALIVTYAAGSVLFSLL